MGSVTHMVRDTTDRVAPNDLAIMDCGHWLQLGCDLSHQTYLPCPKCPRDERFDIASAMCEDLAYFPRGAAW